MAFTRAERTAITIEAIMAVKKESIRKPGMKLETRKRSVALITKRKRPRVRIVTGRVSITKIGLIRALRIAITRATKIAVRNESILNPGTMYVVKSKINALSTSSAKNFIKLV